MALQLILGGSGYGKSTFLYEEIIRKSTASQDTSFYVIVPEQYTMQTEKDIIMHHPGKGIMNIDVLSFRRLAYRVMEETGAKQLPLLDDIGKKLVLGKIVEQQKNNLILYKNKVKMPGFVEEIKSVIAELYQYGIGEEELKKMQEAAKNKSMLSAKLKDISLIRNAFQKYIEEKYITSEELLEVLCREIPKAAGLKNCSIFLDGFTGFTPIQYKVIQELLLHCKDVTVTVCADAVGDIYTGELKETLFGLSKTTATKLRNQAQSLGIEQYKDVLLEDEAKSRFKDNRELFFLERHLFRGDKSVYDADMESVHINEYRDIVSEARAVAAKILSLVRDDGLRYQDIAVVTGNVEGYSEELLEAFGECNIPCFVDSKTKLMSNPFVLLIRSLLEVARTDYSYESVFALLRTGMITMDKADIDYLADYCATLGIRGLKRYQATWSRSHIKGKAVDFEHLNSLREELITPLSAMTEVLSDKTKTVREKMTALYEIICSDNYKCEDKLNEYKKKFEDAGELALSKEFAQCYKLVMGLFDKIVDLLGEECMPLEELIAVMEAGLYELKVGIIPPSVDRVLIGDIERSRLSAIKHLFFVGVNDGIVPKNGKNTGIISEAERNFLSDADFSLAPTARQNLYIQRYYLYLSLTKPASGIHISYSITDSQGGEMKPSILIGQLMRMFPRIRVNKDNVFGEAGITTAAGSINLFIEGLENAYDAWNESEDIDKQRLFEELYSWYLRSDEWKSKIKELSLDAAFYENKESSIAKEVAAALYGPQPVNSVTRIEQYAQCAYAHFLMYGLRLREKEEYEVTARDIGNLFHSTIENYGKKLKENKLEWTTVGEAEKERLVDEAIAEVTADYKASVLASNARSAYITNRLKRITMRTVWALTEQLKKGDFLPRYNEVAFSELEGLKALTIDLGDGRSMRLKGRIDRLDVCEDKEKRYLKVIDYKSGKKQFDLSHVYHGLDLQLVLYMEAVRESEANAHPDKEVIAAGMFYYNISDPVVDDAEATKSDEDVEKDILGTLRMNGLVNMEGDTIRRFDRECTSGKSTVIPVAYKKDGMLASESQTMTDNQYNDLCGFVREKIKDMGISMLDGDIKKSPYVMDNKTGCDYCKYKAICGYDETIKGYEPRHFMKMKPDEVWKKMMEGGTGDGDDKME